MNNILENLLTLKTLTYKGAMILVYTKTRFSWLNINFPQNGKMIAVHAVSQDKCILPLFRQFRNQSYSSLGGGGWREGGVGFRRF